MLHINRKPEYLYLYQSLMNISEAPTLELLGWFSGALHSRLANLYSVKESKPVEKLAFEVQNKRRLELMK